MSEIAIVRCVFNMAMMDICTPPHTVSDDAIKGKWVRVPRDLNLQNGMCKMFPVAKMETETTASC